MMVVGRRKGMRFEGIRDINYNIISNSPRNSIYHCQSHCHKHIHSDVDQI